MKFLWLILVIGGILGVFLLLSKFSPKNKLRSKKKKFESTENKTDKKQRKKDVAPEFVQQLLDFEQIKPNGILQLKDGYYSLVLEVQQIPIRLKSQMEKNQIWMKNRELANSLGIRTTWLVNSNYIDMSEYTEEYRQNADDNELLTEELRASAHDVANYLSNISEQKTRDYNAFIILRLNPYKENDDQTLQTGNYQIDQLIKKINSKTTDISDEEADDIVESLFDEVSEIIFQGFASMGAVVKRLNHIGILNMIYETLNRDLASIQNIHDASEAGSFSIFKTSLTPYIAEMEEEEIEQEYAELLEQDQYGEIEQLVHAEKEINNQEPITEKLTEREEITI